MQIPVIRTEERKFLSRLEIQEHQAVDIQKVTIREMSKRAAELFAEKLVESTKDQNMDWINIALDTVTIKTEDLYKLLWIAETNWKAQAYNQIVNITADFNHNVFNV